MTEQPEQTRTEQEWLGNSNPPLGGGIQVDPELLDELRRDSRVSPVEKPTFGPFQPPAADLHAEAESHAVHGVKALENGELDSGIAWLQSALAFALNARHVRDAEAGA